MGRIKDILYNGEYVMGYEEDLTRENVILHKNVRDLQEQLNKAHLRIKHLSDKTTWAEIEDENQMKLKLND